MGDIGNSENFIEGKYHQLIKCLMLFITTPGEENKINLPKGKRAWIGPIHPPLF